MAHVLKPMERDPRLREDPKARFINQSFAFGDIVVPVSADGKVEEGSQIAAAVVRVLYARRAGNQQARRLLILCEVTTEGSSFTLPDSKAFFPASWPNWTCKLKAGSDQEHETLTKLNMRALEKVCVHRAVAHV